jgi:predicted acylesterase/phospholipase RssA
MDASNNESEPKDAEPKDAEPKDAEPKPQTNKPIIKNIIITGGGPAILNSYGALKEVESHGYWKYESVKSFYGTSAGSILSLMLALGYPLETIGKYLIGRPWKTVFGLGSINFYECFVGNGHLDGNLFYDAFGPLMKGKDMDINITFQQFNEVLGKELYFYTLNLKTAKVEELSHKTQPHMRVIDGVYASSALPVLFKPFKYGESTYTDGGIYSNYPIAKCLAHGHAEETILGVRIRTQLAHISENMSLFEYIGYLVNMVLTYTQDTLIVRKNDICLNVNYEDFSDMLRLVDSPEERAKEIEKGKQDARQWIRGFDVSQTPDRRAEGSTEEPKARPKGV